jgi:SpoVK/Ycf46/Vps4 family AAA+-type ATPase
LLADLVEHASRSKAGFPVLLTGSRGRSRSRAVEALAFELDRPLHRIDISEVVSKYIGETEKSLSRVFDAAEEAGAVLLFDEADALFGRRAEVKDSHDRYERLVGYLLGRMHGRTGVSVVAVESRDELSQLHAWFDEVIDLDSDDDETG